MRPIDADALLTVPNVSKVTEFDEAGEGITYLAVPVEAIEKAPTIEAEPVVHCKDCKYSKKFYITGNRYCDFHGAYEYPVSDDDYCSNGAKMDLEG